MPFSHLPALVSAWLSQIVGVLDRRSAPRLLLLLLGALFARGRRTVTSWFRAAGITRRLPPGLQRPLGRRPTRRRPGLPPARPRPAAADAPAPPATTCSSPSTTRPRRATAPASRAPASITTPRPGRPARSSSTATSGSRSPGWPGTRCGTPCPCRSAPCSTSAPRTCPRWPRTTPGSSAPSWNWPSNWSAG